MSWPIDRLTGLDELAHAWAREGPDRIALASAPVRTSASSEGHALVQRVLEALDPSSDLPFVWTTTPLGKPYWPGSPLHFSLAHTTTDVFMVVAESPVGVDAERTDRRLRDPEGLALWLGYSGPEAGLIPHLVAAEASFKRGTPYGPPARVLSWGSPSHWVGICPSRPFPSSLMALRLW